MMTIARRNVSDHHIRGLLRFRRARAAALGENLFSDPAWDILLHLYETHLKGDCARLSELALAAEAPVSVTARWVAVLEDRGLIAPRREALDPSQRAIQLSARGAALMERFLENWKEVVESF